ncbi:hypothetical protein CC86DRAFT_386978 [Ophiobolus disseminans]|uniref:Uncharacterized protein n=1 Tax=Ophiobolus disseminans TaxID=1469910 RepID=A0A6A6ZH81_9PLEO|nr:hypothetical protein CC86DRAFT_386978 [Ophiobolus disseminans]
MRQRMGAFAAEVHGWSSQMPLRNGIRTESDGSKGRTIRTLLDISQSRSDNQIRLAMNTHDKRIRGVQVCRRRMLACATPSPFFCVWGCKAAGIWSHQRHYYSCIHIFIGAMVDRKPSGMGSDESYGAQAPGNEIWHAFHLFSSRFMPGL